MKQHLKQSSYSKTIMVLISTSEHSLHELLGFKKVDEFEGRGRFIGSNIVNIANVTQLIFNCNITETNYKNEQEIPFIFNFPIDVPAGYRLTHELANISYKNLTISQISHICVWVVDQDGRPVNIRSDTFIVTLSL